jgi:pimeloyl-ACP methyl ester carboxylesterase
VGRRRRSAGGGDRRRARGRDRLLARRAPRARPARARRRRRGDPDLGQPRPDTAALRADRRAADADWAALLRSRGTAAFADAWEQQALFATAARADPARRARRRAAREALDPAALARALETTGLADMPDYRAALAARASRAHLIVGGDDARFVALAGDAVAHAPALLVEVLADVGHDPTLENPDALAGLLARALARWSHP